MSVKAKQSPWCRRRGFPRAKDPNGKQCYNPFAVCKSSVGVKKSVRRKKKGLKKRKSPRRKSSRSR